MSINSQLFSKVYHYTDAETLAASVAQRLRDIIHETLQEKANACLALSGGSTPLLLYKELLKNQYERTIDWQSLRFYFGDERLVAANHPDSNFYQAEQALFLPKKLSKAQIFPMQPACELPENSLALAERYREILKNLPRNNQNLPILDLVLLGIGHDGHIASLFPGQTACPSWVCVTEASQAPKARLSLSASVLGAAKKVLLMAGAEKSQIVKKIAAPRFLDRQAPLYPVDALHGHPALEWHLTFRQF